jgi:hypothetical protein
MYTTGKVTGAAARKYPGYCWREPVYRPLTLRDVDPNRLDPLHEYPRDTALYLPDTATVDLCAYEFRIGATELDGLAPATLTLLPGQYTQAKDKSVVWRARVSLGGAFWRRYLDEALDEAFSPPRAAGGTCPGPACPPATRRQSPWPAARAA